MKRALTLVVAAACGLVAVSCYASQTMYLFLKVNGSDVLGESARVGTEGAIVVRGFSHEVSTLDGRTGTTGSASYAPLRIVKDIDKSSPTLYEALAQNQMVEAELHFYRDDVDTGDTVHFYSISIAQGRISSIRTVASDDTQIPEREIVSFVFGTITWNHITGSSEHTENTQPKA